jgi:integrase
MESAIKENKPTISASSLKTYISLLKSLYHKKHEKGDINLAWFNNQDEIIELLKDKPASSRKTTYAALIAIAKDNNKYKAALLDDGKTYDKFIKTQTKTEKQEENWKSFEEVQKIFNDMHTKIKPLLNSKELSPTDYKKLQDFILLALTSGVFISPRRSMDWVDMKIKNIDKAKDNYIDKNDFVFNKYKTAKFYETQKVSIPKQLKTILNKFIKLNPHEYLLTDDKGNKMTNVRLTQKLNKIFDGAISTSMLRHIYLTEQLKNVPALEKLEKMAHDMGHSVGEALEYVKR